MPRTELRIHFFDQKNQSFSTDWKGVSTVSFNFIPPIHLLKTKYTGTYIYSQRGKEDIPGKTKVFNSYYMYFPIVKPVIKDDQKKKESA